MSSFWGIVFQIISYKEYNLAGFNHQKILLICVGMGLVLEVLGQPNFPYHLGCYGGFMVITQ